ncbi:MAG: WG repeat-containing protein, partial [Prevotella sp.]|nr:WG repeat-containing protein [Prevotella sp.]
GYINKNNKLVIPNEYKEARSFYDGLAFVKGEGRRAYYIDKNNEVNIFLRKEYTVVEKVKLIVLSVAVIGIIVLLISKLF